MELLLVLFLIALTDRDPELKARLRSVLEFYRENRELLRSLADRSDPPEGAQKRPSDQGESLKILETFLKGV